MTIVAYKKAEKIHDELNRYRKLRRICYGTYKKYILAKKFLWLSTYQEDEIALCDKELSELIVEYCDKKINELEKQLEVL